MTKDINEQIKEMKEKGWKLESKRCNVNWGNIEWLIDKNFKAGQLTQMKEELEFLEKWNEEFSICVECGINNIPNFEKMNERIKYLKNKIKELEK